MTSDPSPRSSGWHHKMKALRKEDKRVREERNLRELRDDKRFERLKCDYKPSFKMVVCQTKERTAVFSLTTNQWHCGSEHGSGSATDFLDWCTRVQKNAAAT